MFEVIANDLDAPLAREYRRYMRSQVTAREQWCISILLVCCVPTATTIMLCCSSARPPCSWWALQSASTVHANGPSIGYHYECVIGSNSSKRARLREQVVPEVQRIAGLLQEHAAVLELPPTAWYEKTFKQDDAKAMNPTTVRVLHTMRLLA